MSSWVDSFKARAADRSNVVYIAQMVSLDCFDLVVSLVIINSR